MRFGVLLLVACGSDGLGFDPRDPTPALTLSDLVEFCTHLDRNSCSRFAQCAIGPQLPCIPTSDHDHSCPLASCGARRH